MPRISSAFVRWLIKSIFIGSICLAVVEFGIFVSNSMVRPPLLGLENQLVDIAFQVRPYNEAHGLVTADEVVIIDIDDASIQQLGRPQMWPRLYDARAIDHVAKGNPFAIGVDYLYTEADELPEGYATLLRNHNIADTEQVLQAFRTDDSLVQVIASAGMVYLSLFEDDSAEPDQEIDLNGVPLLRGAKGVAQKAPTMKHPRAPVANIRAGARATGSIAMPSDPDGTIRHYQALSRLVTQRVDGRAESESAFIANFPLLMVLDTYGLPFDAVVVNQKGIAFEDELLVPLSNKASFRVNWLGAEEEIRYISFYKVVEGLVPSEFFEGKVVFFGTSASGMQDLKTVPVGFDKMPGVEVHAVAFLNMINGAFINEVDAATARPYLWIVGLILTAFFLLIRPLPSFVIAVSLIAAELAAFIVYILPVKGMVFPIVNLMLLTLFAHILSALYIYFIRERNVRKLRNAFSAYVPKEVVAQIARDSSSVKLGGERKELSVLFSDIRGFTTYSEKLSPEALVAFLNRYLDTMSEAIFKHQGTIDKFIGDAIMAIFGAPIMQGDHADRACLVALDMIAALDRLNHDLLNEGMAVIDTGIGINTGDMTVGNVGSMRRFDYTVIGDAVNISARLESLTKFFGVNILVSKATRKACTNEDFVFRSMGLVRLQGKQEETAVFELCTDRIDPIELADWEEALALLYAGDASNALGRLETYSKNHSDSTAVKRFIALTREVKTNGSEPVFAPGK